MFANNNLNKTVFASNLKTINLATGLPKGYAGAGASYGSSFVTYGILAGGTSGGSGGTGGGGTGGGGTGGGDSSFAYYILLKYSDLAKIVRTINNLMYQFSLGNYDYVIANFTSVVYYNLSQELYKIKEDSTSYPDYEEMRVNVVRGLEGLNKSVLLYKEHSSTLLQLESQTQKANILDDMDKLRDYIRGLHGSISLFPDMYVTSIAATLKPEIAIYIQLYGYPEGGVFEADKLAFALTLVPEDQQNDVGNDLSGNDLSGNDLSGNDLSGNDLSGNDLSGNDLSGNDLSGNDILDSDLVY